MDIVHKDSSICLGNSFLLLSIINIYLHDGEPISGIILNVIVIANKDPSIAGLKFLWLQGRSEIDWLHFEDQTDNHLYTISTLWT